MADNIQTPGGSGGDPAVATDEIGGAHYQKVKIALGTENQLDGLLGGGQQTMASSVPVAIASDQSAVSVADGGGSLTIDDGGGSLTIDGTVEVAAGPAGANALQIQGTAAHDAAAGQNPMQIGAEARSSERSAVANADVARLVADLAGKLITRPHCNPENQISGASSTTSTGDTSVIAAQGAGIRIYVTSLSIANSSANNPVIEIKSASTVIWRTIAPAGGGSNVTFDPPLRLAANEALNMASLAASTTVYFSANGYSGA
ncbi:MAG: hypothetical protein AB7S71_14840 [Dongiaceae bacterium]